MMKAKDFRQEQDYPYNHFTKLTNTGISPDYDNIEEFAEEYHESKVKNLGLFSVGKRSELLIAFCRFLFTEMNYTTETDYTPEEQVEVFLKSNL